MDTTATNTDGSTSGSENGSAGDTAVLRVVPPGAAGAARAARAASAGAARAAAGIAAAAAGTTPGQAPAGAGVPAAAAAVGPGPGEPAGGVGTRAGVWGRVEQQDFRSRVRGALLGGALGDAYGRQGAVTAATQLTMFTVDGLIRAHVRRDTGGWHPPTDVHRAYRRWYATQHDWGPDERREDNGWLGNEEWLYVRRDPQRACLTGFGDDAPATPDRPKNPTARDAAAALRSAPFGLLVGWEPALVLQLTVECAVQSHGHPAAYLSAGAFAVIVHGLTRGVSLDTAVRRALALLAARPGHEPVTEALHRALTAATRGEPGPGPGGDRTAEDALAVAVHCALAAEDVPHGLRLASAGPAGPAVPLCGALLGALHGETALPAAGLAELEGRALLLQLADDLALELTQGPALHGPATTTSAWLTRYPRA